MLFRGSITPPARPLSTLRCALAGRQRMTRGQRDWLDLRRRALSSPAPCRFIPTLSPITHHVADPEPTRAECRSKPGRPRTHTNPTTRPRTPSRPRSAGIHADGRTPHTDNPRPTEAANNIKRLTGPQREAVATGPAVVGRSGLRYPTPAESGECRRSQERRRQCQPGEGRGVDGVDRRLSHVGERR